MAITIIYITCPDKKTASKISAILLKKKLIGCANFFPIKSMYHWKGKIVNSNETVILAKTTKTKTKKIEIEVRKVHPYDKPCILRFNAQSNQEYESWIKDETS